MGVAEVVDDPKCRRSGSLSVVVRGEVRLCCLQPPRTGSNWHKPGVLLTAAVEFSREPRRRLRRTTTLLELLREKLLQPLHCDLQFVLALPLGLVTLSQLGEFL